MPMMYNSHMNVLDGFRQSHPSLGEVPLFGEPVSLSDGSELALFDGTQLKEPCLIVYTHYGEGGYKGKSFEKIYEPFVSNEADGDFRKGAVIIARERIKRLNQRSLQG
jgi:hypothetical protein